VIRFSVLYSLLFVLASVQFQPTFILLKWKINQEQIIAEQCVNKNEPEKKCHGKCQLNAELKKVNPSTQSSEPAPETRVDLTKLISDLPNANSFFVFKIQKVEPEFNSVYLAVLHKAFLKDCFQPPENFI
jgi:hypothetical protein